MKIQITHRHPASFYGVPVVLIDGRIADPKEALDVCCQALGWTIDKTAEMTGKTRRSIYAYRSGQVPIPAEVWNVIDAELNR